MRIRKLAVLWNAEKAGALDCARAVAEAAEKLGAKIRQAHLEKVPYTVIIGAKEAQDRTVTIRLRSGKNVENVKLEDFISKLKEENDTRSLANLYN